MSELTVVQRRVAQPERYESAGLPRARVVWSDHPTCVGSLALDDRAERSALLMYSTMMPFAMLVLFSQVFRSIQDGLAFPVGVAYIDYLAPAMLAVSAVMGATNSGCGHRHRPEQWHR
jgi:hypothetical protein